MVTNFNVASRLPLLSFFVVFRPFVSKKSTIVSVGVSKMLGLEEEAELIGEDVY